MRNLLALLPLLAASGCLHVTEVGKQDGGPPADAAVPDSGGAVDSGCHCLPDGGGWTPSHGGLWGGAAGPLVFDVNQVLYTGTANGVFKSTDRAATWTAARGGLPLNIDVLNLSADPATAGTVYAAILLSDNTYAAYKTANAGAQWAQLTGGLAGIQVNNIAVDPSSASTVYVASDNGAGLYKSTNGGATFAASATGLASTSLYRLAFDTTAPGTIYAGDAAGQVEKSTDGASSWHPTGPIPTNGIQALWAIAVDPATASTVYAGSSTGLWVSTNGGGAWTNFGLTNQVYGIHISGTPEVFWVETDQGLLKSTNGGASWTPTGLGNFPLTVLPDPTAPGVLYATGATAGIVKSIDGAQHWNISNHGLAGLQIARVVVDPHTPTTLYATTSVGLYTSANGGADWSSLIPSPPAGTTLIVDPSNSSTLYVATALNPYKSTDRGATWTAVGPLPNSWAYDIAINPSSPGTLIAAFRPGLASPLYQSTNGAMTWGPLSSPLMGGAGAIHLLLDPTQPSNVYVSGEGEPAVYGSTNGGMTWATLGTGPSHVTSWALDLTSPGTLYTGTVATGVFKSTDHGAHWTADNAGLLDLQVTTVVADPSQSGVVYAGTRTAGLFVSTDGAAHWASLNAGLTSVDIEAVALDPLNPLTAYVASLGDVYKSTAGGN